MVHKAPLVLDDQSQIVEVIRQKSPASTTSSVFSSPSSDRAMPPAPRDYTPGATNRASPTASLGDEAGQEALWIEEELAPTDELSSLVKESDLSEAPEERRQSFWDKRKSVGGRLWKRNGKGETPTIAEEEPPAKKMSHTVRLLETPLVEEEPTANPVLAVVTQQARETSLLDLASVEDDFAEAPAPATLAAPCVTPAATQLTGPCMAPETFAQPPEVSLSMKQAVIKGEQARRLLALALHPDTVVSEIEGLAQSAFAEATAARLLVEGSDTPKGLDLVLRAASHKGRSAVLAAAFCPENVAQVSRAHHYMDLILPPDCLSITSKNLAMAGLMEQEDVSTIAMDHTLSGSSNPNHQTVTTGGGAASRAALSPLSMTSLDEFLDAPLDEEDQKEEKQQSPMKHRLPFLHKKKSSKQDPPEMMPQTHAEEMPPSEDAPGMDDDGASWGDDSAGTDFEEGDNLQAAKSTETSKSTKKRLRFRLFRGAGGAAAAATSRGRNWLRTGKSKDEAHVVDHIPDDEPTAPYQSRSYQRFQAKIDIDDQTIGRKSVVSKDVSVRVMKVHDVDVETHHRIERALMADETEALTSFDGVRMFGHNIKAEDEAEEEEQQPPEVMAIASELSSMSLRSVKMEPQFIQAPAGAASILTAMSWDSLIADDAVHPDERPLQSVLPTLLDNYTEEDEGIPAPPEDHYATTPSRGDAYSVSLMPSGASPDSYGTATPGLTDKYASTEEQVVDESYATEGQFAPTEQPVEEEEYVEENIADKYLILSGDDSFEAQATDEELMRVREGEENQMPETPSRRLRMGGFISLMQSRRKNQVEQTDEEQAEAEGLQVEEAEFTVNGEDAEVVLSPRENQTPDRERKTRRKLKLFKAFQKKKSNNPVEVEHSEDMEPEVNDYKWTTGSFILQDTATLTDNTFSADEAEPRQPWNEPVDQYDDYAAPVEEEEEEADPLILSIRNQQHRVHRGMDPMTSHGREIARGIDP